MKKIKLLILALVAAQMMSASYAVHRSIPKKAKSPQIHGLLKTLSKNTSTEDIGVLKSDFSSAGGGRSGANAVADTVAHAAISKYRHETDSTSWTS